MYTYKIAPRSKTKSLDTYDYLSSCALPQGALVEIELGRSKVRGVVFDENPKSHFAKKEISRILNPKSVFTQVQFELAKRVQDEYLGAFGETIFSFIPTMNLSDLRNIGKNKIASVKKYRGKNELVIGPFSSRLSYYTQLASVCSGQMLFVLPEIKEIDDFQSNLKKILPHKKIIVFHSQLTSKQKGDAWSLLLSGKDAIVISTRQGLFLPFTNLSLLCIDDPLNFAYQEDQAPYYQAFFVSRKLKDITGAQLIIGESIPDISSYIAYKNKKIEIKKINSKYEIKLEEPFYKLEQNIPLLKNLEKILQSKGRICFIGPWRNQIGIKCEDCSVRIACKKCKGEYFDEGLLSCASCGEKLSTCYKCNSIKLKKIGFSYGEMKNKLSEIFPNYTDSITDNPKHFGEKQIIVASPKSILKSKINIQAAVFPYFDKMSDFALMGYRHKIFRLVWDLSRFSVSEVYLCGENLQENKFASEIKVGAWKNFLDDEIKKRKKANLPPFSKAVNVVCKTKNKIHISEKLKLIEEETGLNILPVEYSGSDSSRKTVGIFFVPNSQSTVLSALRKTNLGKCHLEINNGDYL